MSDELIPNLVKRNTVQGKVKLPMAKLAKKPVVSPSNKEDTGRATTFAKSFLSIVHSITKDKTAARLLSDAEGEPSVKSYIPTGLVDLDRVLSNGHGVPVGRAIEIYGRETTGKTALCEWLVAKAVEGGHPVLYLDAETAIDAKHMKGYGVSVESVNHAEPENMEQCWALIYAFLKHHAADKKSKPGLIVWDSVAATPTKAEIAADGDITMAEQARVMSRHSRIFRRRLSRSNVAMVFTNQVRSGINIKYGDGLVRPCGKALDFMCDTILKTATFKTEADGTGEDRKATGYHILVKATKSRLGTPQAQTVFFLSFKCGIDPATSSLNLLKKLKIAKASAGTLVINKVPMKSKEWRDTYASDPAKYDDLICAKMAAQAESIKENDPDEESETSDD